MQKILYAVQGTGNGHISRARVMAPKLEQAGFDIIAIRDRRQFAAECFAETRRRMETSGGNPPLGVHIAMGDSASVKIRNMVENIAAGRVSPVEIIARNRER